MTDESDPPVDPSPALPSSASDTSESGVTPTHGTDEPELIPSDASHDPSHGASHQPIPSSGSAETDSVEGSLPLEPYPMGLQFRDFVPQQLSNFGLFKVAEYETFEAAVWAANRWLIESPIELIQLETVVLPNIWSKYEEGTTDGSLGTSTGATSHWHQFLRVWYRPCPPDPSENA